MNTSWDGNWLQRLVLFGKAIVILGLIILGIFFVVSNVLSSGSSQSSTQTDYISPNFLKELKK